MKLSFNRKRLIVGIASLIPVFCVANSLFDLHIFGRFDKKVLTASFVFIALILHYFGPTLREVQEYREARQATKNR
jgi:hypothetical protein